MQPYTPIRMVEHKQPNSRLDWIWNILQPPPLLLEEPLVTIYSSRPNSNFGYALQLADLGYYSVLS